MGSTAADTEAMWNSFVAQAVGAGKPGDMTGVIALFRERVEKANLSAADRRQVGALFHELSTVVRRRGDGVGAVSGYEEAARYFREAGDKPLLQQALASQADALIDGGEFQRAIPIVAERTRLCREIGDQASLLSCLAVQGKLLHWVGDSEHAAAIGEQQEELARELGGSDGIAVSLSNRGLLLVAEGRLDEAQPLLEEAERLLRTGSDRKQLANTIGARAVVIMQKGDNDGALALQREAEAICRETGDDEGLAKALVMQGLVLNELGRPAEGLPLAQEADRLARRLGLTSMADEMIAPVLGMLQARGATSAAGEPTVLSLFDAASTHLHAGRLDEAVSLLTQARDLARSTGDARQAESLTAYLDQVKQVAGGQRRSPTAPTASDRYQRDLAEWSRLSWIKRLTTPKPRPPR